MVMTLAVAALDIFRLASAVFAGRSATLGTLDRPDLGSYLGATGELLLSDHDDSNAKSVVFSPVA